MAYSMTGFARMEESFEWGTLSCELKSVNHRYLEAFYKLSDEIKPFESELRGALKQKLSRGKVEVLFLFRNEEGASAELKIDQSKVKALSELARQVQGADTDARGLSVNDYLRWPGVVVSEELDTDQLKSEALKLFDQAIDRLLQHRAREGTLLVEAIKDRLKSIRNICETIQPKIPLIVQNQFEKYKNKVEAFDVSIDADRLAQEFAQLAQKADVEEELDRLFIHIKELEKALQSDKPLGRRLDFLMQEFNREANTLGSKSIDAEMTQASVDLKVGIEQIREQIQNLE